MPDFHQISDYVLSLIIGWVGFIHHELKARPTRDELMLRLENIEIKIDQVKEDINEFKNKTK